MPVETRILFAFHTCSGGFEADGEQELIEAGDYAHIEPVKLGTADILQLCIGAEWAELCRLRKRIAEIVNVSSRLKL